MNSEKIKNDINLHVIETDKFKTNIISIFLTTELDRKNVTKEALIPAVLRLGTNNIKTQRELNKRLEEMYGANFNCGIEKRGDNHVLKFYIESIEDKYALNKEKILEESINFLIDIVFNPLIVNETFDKNYVEGEKENLAKIIQSKIDNKGNYAYIRCIEEMYKNKKYGIYEYGYVEDLPNINEKNLYDYYREFIQECKIDIFISGKTENKNIKEIIEKNENIKKLQSRQAKYIHNSLENVENEKEKYIEERMDVTQGKLVIGLNVKNSQNEEHILNVYNAILGGDANSKLFQNVREKASLAYSAGSGYLKAKNNIFIRCGIEIKNYKKTIEIIREQLKAIEDGTFSEKDIKNAKELIIASINSIPDEQANEISYYFAQELYNNKITINEFADKIKNVTREDIIEIAKKVHISTIYFLKDNK